MPGRVVSEELYDVFSISTTAISCLFNSLLIYVLAVTKVRHVGPYRWLLMSFAAVDLSISLVHTATIPSGCMTEFGFIAIPIRFLNMPTNAGFWSMLCWSFLFYQTFILLTFHYVYRFVLLCRPSWLVWTQRSPWVIWISTAVVADLLYTGTVTALVSTLMQPTEKYRRYFAPLVREVYDADLFADNLPGFVVVMYSTPPEIAESDFNERDSINFVFALTVSSIFVILYCSRRIVRAIRGDHTESNTRRMQQQLFRALVWQTLVPVFTTYIPIGLIITSLACGKAVGDWVTVMLMSTQLFPMIDPFLILFFVPRYRYAFTRRLRPKISSVKSIESRGTGTNGIAPINSSQNVP